MVGRRGGGEERWWGAGVWGSTIIWSCLVLVLATLESLAPYSIGSLQRPCSLYNAPLEF